MFERRKTKKDMYREGIIDVRTYINGETAIKPYYYLRNGLLHVRYTVDRCMELSSVEATRVKMDLADRPYDKQGVLEKAWNFYSNTVGKDIIMDGIAELEKRMKEYKENGYKNQGSNI